MFDLVEAIKLLGGIAGLGTAAFTIYDRLVKSRPVISLTAAAHQYDDVGVLFIRLSNRSDSEIVISSIETHPETAAYLHDDLRSTIDRAMGLGAARLIAPGETIFVEVYLDDELREKLSNSGEELQFRAYWHRAAGPTWLQGLPLKAVIRCDDLDLILKDAARRDVRAPNAVLSPRDL